MNFYRYAVWSGAISIVILLLIILSPKPYFILEWDKSYLQAGFLFPVLLAAWLFSTMALAFNFIYIERLHMHSYLPDTQQKKYLPVIFCIPSFISFIWFCYQLCKGM